MKDQAYNIIQFHAYESGQHGKDIDAIVCARKKGGQATPVRKDTDCGDYSSGALPGAVLPLDAGNNLNSVYVRLAHVICKQQPQPFHGAVRDFKGDEVDRQDSQGHDTGQGHSEDGGKRLRLAAPRGDRRKEGLFRWQEGEKQ